MFSYSDPSRILGYDGKQNSAGADSRARELLYFPLVLINRLKRIESAVFIYCRFLHICKYVNNKIKDI